MAVNKKTTAKKPAVSRAVSADKTPRIQHRSDNTSNPNSSGRERRNELKPEILSIIMIAICILLILSLFLTANMGIFGSLMKTVLAGCFGLGAYVVPFAAIVFCVLTIFMHDYSLDKPQLIMSAFLFMILISLVHITNVDSREATEGVFQYIAVNFNNGGVSNGGLLGATFGDIFLKFLDKVGSYILLITSAVILTILISGKSLFGLLRKMREKTSEMVESARVRRVEKEYDDKPFVVESLKNKKMEVYDVPSKSRDKRVFDHRIDTGNEESGEPAGEKLDLISKPGTKSRTALEEMVEGVADYTPAFYDPKLKTFELKDTPQSVETEDIEKSEIRLVGDIYDPVRDFDKAAAEIVKEAEVVKEAEAPDVIENIVDLRPKDSAKLIPFPTAKSLKEDIDNITPFAHDGISKDENDSDARLINETLKDEAFNEFEDIESILMTGDIADTDDMPATIKHITRDSDRVQILEDIYEEDLEDCGEGEQEKIEEIDYENYEFPPVELMNASTYMPTLSSKAEILENSRKLEETLKSFDIIAKVVEVSKGPAVTRYELSPGLGVKISAISNRADDIALNLAAVGIRIEAPIPGKSVVGIEVPNKEVQPVFLRELIEDDKFRNFKSKLAFAVGKDIAGNFVIDDIEETPHLLVAGATGSGKSVFINTLITSILYKARPDEVKLIMIDPKVVELRRYNDIPHLLLPVVTEPKEAAAALAWAVNEMEARYRLIADSNVSKLAEYNQKKIEKGEKDLLPRIVIIIDELADLMAVASKEVEMSICRLAQKARAAGLHLIVATQRPSVNVITGLIKANIPSRIAFAVTSGIDSRTVLDTYGAEKLLGRGDMLYAPKGTVKPIRIQGANITSKEIEAVIQFMKEHYPKAFDEDLISQIKSPEKASSDSGKSDSMLEEAVQYIISKEKASVSMLQRHFRIGYNKAANLMEEIESHGVVGPEDGAKPRRINMTLSDWQRYKRDM